VLYQRRAIEQRATLEQRAGQDKLLSRVPVAEGARLPRISSDNHHIHIVTITGDEHRLLMRLRGAVEEIDVEAVFCVHRSHWVAKSALLGVAKEGKRELVELACGSKIPIGPKYRNNLIEAGVINV
jgi:DNA-binding LytR/AlgR family response regulator